jgi:hypothetical protein
MYSIESVLKASFNTGLIRVMYWVDYGGWEVHGEYDNERASNPCPGVSGDKAHPDNRVSEKDDNKRRRHTMAIPPRTA